MKSPISFLFILTLIGFGCDRLDGLDEGDKNTFTWKGRLVQDCGEEPVANQDIFLEVDYSGTPVGDSEIICESTTDEEGNFSMTYRNIGKLSEGIGFYLEGNGYTDQLIMRAPVNRAVERDITLENCQTLVLKVTNKGAPTDSVFLGTGPLLEPNQTSIVNLFEVDSTWKFRVLGLQFNDDKASRVIKRQIQFAQSWNNEPVNTIMGYGISLKDVKRSLLSVYVDSIPSGYNQVEFISHGFPFIDTLEIEIE